LKLKLNIDGLKQYIKASSFEGRIGRLITIVPGQEDTDGYLVRSLETEEGLGWFCADQLEPFYQVYGKKH